MVISIYMELQVICQRCGIWLGREEVRLLRTVGNTGHTDGAGRACTGDVTVSTAIEFRDPSGRDWVVK